MNKLPFIHHEMEGGGNLSTIGTVTQDTKQGCPFWGQSCLKGFEIFKFALLYIFLSLKPSSNPGSATKFLVTLGTSLQLSVSEATGPQRF